jgi:hypothetical protein
MALSLNGPLFKTCASVAVTTTTAATTSATFTIPIADSYTFYLVATVAQSNMSCGLQTSIDAGTTWVNTPWKFAAATTTTGTYVLNVRSGLGPGMEGVMPVSQGGVFTDGGLLPTTGTAIAAVVDPRYMRLSYATTGSSTFVVYVGAWPRGATAGVD